MTKAKKKVEVISFEDKRGFPGSIETKDRNGDTIRVHIQCACNGNYTRETRKLKTIPVNVRAIQEGHANCDKCKTMPFFVLPKKAGEKTLYDWRGKANKSLEREAAA